MGSVKFSPDTDIPSLEGKVILITGGNSGLGLETARQLLKHNPARLYLACRSKTKFEKAVAELKEQGSKTNAVSFLALDLASFASIKSAAKELRDASTRLDILVNNAGIMMTPEGTTEEGYEVQIGTNHMGHALLTHLLLPTLEETAKVNPDVRIIFVSSAGESVAPKDPYHFDQFKTTMPNISTTSRYGISKLANVHYAAALAERHPKIKIISLHPGIVKTNLDSQYVNNNLIMGKLIRVAGVVMGVDASKGALNQLWAISDPKAESGVFYHPVGVAGKGSKMSQNKEAREKLWEWTQQEIQKHLSSKDESA
jgi:NAD(P)-dependent dehydrogenase (short-subunit alcohol dehydrogenase family)